MGSANRVRISNVPEVLRGVTPATPAFTIDRWTSESLGYNIESVQSEEIRPDRTEGDLVLIGSDSSGDLNFEFSFGTFDRYLSQVFCRPWIAGTAPGSMVLSNGTDKIYCTVMKEFLDMTPPVAHVFKGMVVNQFTLNVAKRAKITGSMSLMGLDVSNVAPVGATFLPATVTQSLNTSSHVTAISLNGVPMTSCIDSMSIQITNNYRPKDCVGKFFHSDFSLGSFSVSGNMELYFDTTEQFDAYKNGTTFSLGMTIVDDANNTYELELLRCKFESLTTNATGENTDVMASGSYRCSGVAGVTARLTKIPA